ncbi:Transposase [Nostoc sp. PCC 7524]|uniref:IS110 family transposase n=1 Tax=Nostoc sp. (strain ATCC 29411 / PCC 7524) TaxID=28072 RepID=UPI00029F2F87|nr:transposase [Nostoc sp. PCC 7524]AFY48884.1 Transposase [Nostoc sp. PCC 7524]
MTNELTILGIDVSKSSVTCHILTQYPKGGLQNYWNKTRNKLSSLYPAFYSNPDAKKKQKSAFDFADYLTEIKPDYAILEPTGNHYSRLWASILKKLEVKILWVGHVELRRYRGGKNLPNKSDPADALAMAAYGHDPDHRLETGELNMRYFLMHRPEPIDELRDLCQQLEHLNRVQSPIMNYARQLLAWQFPEVAQSKSSSYKPGFVPPLWGWLAGSSEISPGGKTRMDNRYQKSIAQDYGIEIDPILKLHAQWMCDISLYEQHLEVKISEMLTDSAFKPYMNVFDQFGFGLRVRSRLLTRIYPFESFLGVDGRPLIEYEVREVKKTERDRKNGETIVKRLAGETKRIKRNRSRDTFKMRLGMGTVLEQSGDGLIEKASGSSLCRISLWQYVLTAVETGRLPSNHLTKELIDYRDSLKSNVSERGEKLLGGKHIQEKLMSKVVNLLFDELCKTFRPNERL